MSSKLQLLENRRDEIIRRIDAERQQLISLASNFSQPARTLERVESVLGRSLKIVSAVGAIAIPLLGVFFRSSRIVRWVSRGLLAMRLVRKFRLWGA